MNDLDLVKSNNFNSIITKSSDINSLTFRTINETHLTEISNWMPEVNRAVACFNKQNTQTTSSLMSLNMIDSTPYRALRQILAQVEKKRSALNENIYKLEKKKLDHKQLSVDIDNDTNTYIQKEKLILKRNKIACDIIDSQGHLEAVLKELGALKRNYEAIVKNNHIPENWDELDFENHEVEHHIKSIFRNAIRDRMQGTHNQGTMEYMEQFGINPITAYAMTDNYINEIKDHINNGRGPDVTAQYNFYENMYNLFKDEYKKAMKRLGLDTIIQADYLMKESK